MHRGPQIMAWMPVMFFMIGLIIFQLNSNGGKQNRPLNAPDNPDHFHLVATKNGCNYSFIYDPLAADQWLFRTGGPWNAHQP